MKQIKYYLETNIFGITIQILSMPKFGHYLTPNVQTQWSRSNYQNYTKSIISRTSQKANYLFSFFMFLGFLSQKFNFLNN